MEITFLTIFLATCLIFTIFGICLKDKKGISFVLGGGLGFLLLGINIMTDGVEQNYIINNTLTAISTETIWTGFYGTLLLLIGIGIIFISIIEIFND